MLRGVEELVGSVLGWERVASPDGVSASFAYAQPDGGRLVLEVGRDGGPWLWVLAGSEARALLLPEHQVTQKLLEALAAAQDELTIGNYFSVYLKLQKHCEISVLAWEQFSVKPPFADSAGDSGDSGADGDSTSSPTGGGWGKSPNPDSGWGNSSG